MPCFLVLDELWASGRQPERERAADTNCALDPQCSTLHLDQALGNRQSKTSPSESARRAGIGLPEFIEDCRLRLRRNADARVIHADLHPLADPAHGAQDVSLLRELD